MDKKLDNELKKCFNVEPSKDFVSNITAQAFAVERKAEKGFVQSIKLYLRQIVSDFNLPQPAYALAALMVLGFFVGFGDSSYGDIAMNDDATAEILSTFYDEGELS